MTTETNAERLEKIKERIDWIELYKTEESFSAMRSTLERMFDKGNIHWLFEQAKRAQELEFENQKFHTRFERQHKENARLREQLSELQKSNPVAVIKRRNGKATIIRWNDERYVFQSESSARGGIAKRG